MNWDLRQRPREHDAEVQDILDLIRSHQLPELRQRLNQRVMKQGSSISSSRPSYPSPAAVGEAWCAASSAVFEEHLYH